MSTSDYVGQPSWFSENKKVMVQFHQAGNQRPVMVDLQSVTHFTDDGDKTSLFFSGGHYLEVSESYDAVVKRLGALRNY